MVILHLLDVLLEVIVEVGGRGLEVAEQREKDDHLDVVAEAVRVLPLLEGEPVRFGLAAYGSRLIEAQSLALPVLLEPNLTLEEQLVAGRHAQEGAAHVELALPHLPDNPVHVLELEEIEQVQGCDLLEDRVGAIPAPLPQKNFCTIWQPVVIANRGEQFHELALDENDAQVETGELEANFVQDLGQLDHNHQRVGPLDHDAFRP